MNTSGLSYFTDAVTQAKTRLLFLRGAQHRIARNICQIPLPYDCEEFYSIPSLLLDRGDFFSYSFSIVSSDKPSASAKPFAARHFSHLIWYIMLSWIITLFSQYFIRISFYFPLSGIHWYAPFPLYFAYRSSRLQVVLLAVRRFIWFPSPISRWRRFPRHHISFHIYDNTRRDMVNCAAFDCTCFSVIEVDFN